MPDFNPVRSYNEGMFAGQEQGRRRLAAEKEALAVKNKAGDARKKANFEDARVGRQLLEAQDFQGFLDFTSNRIGAIESLGGDPSDTKAVLQAFNAGDIGDIINGLKLAEEEGITTTDSEGNAFLSDPLGRQIEQAKLDKLKAQQGQGAPVSVQSAKILDDGTIISVLKGGQRQVTSPTGELLTGEDAKQSVATSRDQAHKRKIELKRLDQTIKRTEQKEGLLNDQQKSIQRSNIRRLGELSGTSSGRNSAVKKATKFKMALEKGEVHSGAGRKGLSFVPGVFTSQGQFDEEFNAFAEVAARQTLKASGETRPTDADVQGMKQAMFGIGRDESVNIQLLNDFIKDQHAQTNELDQLIGASKGGNLSNFTFTPDAKSVNVGELSDEDLFN